MYYIGLSVELFNMYVSPEFVSSISSTSLGESISCISCTQVHSECSSVVTFRLNTFHPSGCTYKDIFNLNIKKLKIKIIKKLLG